MEHQKINNQNIALYTVCNNIFQTRTYYYLTIYYAFHYISLISTVSYITLHFQFENDKQFTFKPVKKSN